MLSQLNVCVICDFKTYSEVHNMLNMSQFPNVPNMDLSIWSNGFFSFFDFVILLKWWLSIRIFSQIWWNSNMKQKTLNTFSYCKQYVIVTNFCDFKLKSLGEFFQTNMEFFICYSFFKFVFSPPKIIHLETCFFFCENNLFIMFLNILKKMKLIIVCKCVPMLLSS